MYARRRACTLAALTMESVLLVKTALRGYHVYQAVWEPRIGESFLALHEGSNVHDSNAMAVYRHEDPGAIVGHLPREISRQCGNLLPWLVRGQLHKIVSDLLPLGARVCAD